MPPRTNFAHISHRDKKIKKRNWANTFSRTYISFSFSLTAKKSGPLIPHSIRRETTKKKKKEKKKKKKKKKSKKMKKKERETIVAVLNQI